MQSLFAINPLKAMYWLIFISLPMHSIGQEKPNIIVVMADDIGLGDIGFYHQERTGQAPIVPTPHIDELIASGMRFSDAHSPASLCAPTRYSMLTGNFSYRNYKPWGVWNPQTDAGIEPKFTTISRIAKEGGYATAFLGKWGLGGVWKDWHQDYSKYKQTQGGAQYYGFDYSLELPQGIQDPPYVFYENGQWMKLEDDSHLVHIPFEQTKYLEKQRKKKRDGIGDSNWDPALAGPIFAQKAASFIEKQREKDPPFFLYYCSQAVHVPHTPSDQLDGTKIAGTTPGRHGDMIKELDTQVGMLIKALKKKGIYQNTLFIFTSDNGGLSLDKALLSTGHTPSNGLRANKGSIYEGGHRVPFIAVWPGQIKAGTESNVPIVGQDVVATLADIVQVELDTVKVFDSASLLPVLTGNSKTLLHQYILHQSQSTGGPYYALREGGWKLILKGEGRNNLKGLIPIGLYNLNKDAREKEEHNLIKSPDQVDRIKRMHQKYLELRQDGGATLF